MDSQREFTFVINDYERSTITVYAETKEEAKEMLNDLLDTITWEDLKNKVSNNKNIEIKKSQNERQIREQSKDLER